MELFTSVSFISLLKSKNLLLVIILSCVVTNLFAQKQTPINTKLSTNKKQISADVATEWAKMTLFILKNTPKGTPTYNSRALGYMGLTMYESVVNGTSNKQSLLRQLSDFNRLPGIPSKKINWILAMNAGQAYMLKHLFEYTSKANTAKIDSFELYIYNVQAETSSEEIKTASVSYGKSVAEIIFEWSKTDGGYQGYSRNFDTTYVMPTGKGFWTVPTKGQVITDYSLHPSWGKNRTFAKANLVLPIPEMLAFGFEADSPYFQNMKAVYDKGFSLTQEEKEIANWWGDDPGHSYSPPGHSYNLATLAILKKRTDLFTAAEAYARVGMGVSDAFVNCWKCKYYYHVERPANYIFYNINTLWELYWPEPPFPAFYSGHATQAAATAVALTAIFGENFEFTDDTNTFIPRDNLHGVDYKPRDYKSFWAAAEETAMSRFYGGIHTQYDNSVGIAEGKKIGQNINQLFNTH